MSRASLAAMLLCVLVCSLYSTPSLANFDVLVESKQCDALASEVGSQVLAKKAENGGAREAFCLGMFYEWGTNGYSRQRSQAAKWYKMSANLGYAASGYSLGELYMRGDGVPRDLHEAMRWYRVSADQGYALAQDALGSLLLESVITDSGQSDTYAEAAKLLYASLFNGYEPSGDALGNLHMNGYGVPKDLVVALALTFYSVLSDVDTVPSTFMKKKLSSQQVKDATLLYREMRAGGVRSALRKHFENDAENYCSGSRNKAAQYLAFPDICSDAHH